MACEADVPHFNYGSTLESLDYSRLGISETSRVYKKVFCKNLFGVGKLVPESN